MSQCCCACPETERGDRVYHSLNKYITLVGEFNDERISNVADSNFDNKNRTISVGGLIFF